MDQNAMVTGFGQENVNDEADRRLVGMAGHLETVMIRLVWHHILRNQPHAVDPAMAEDINDAVIRPVMLSCP